MISSIYNFTVSNLLTSLDIKFTICPVVVCPKALLLSRKALMNSFKYHKYSVKFQEIQFMHISLDFITISHIMLSTFCIQYADQITSYLSK